MTDSTLSRDPNLDKIKRTLEHCLGADNFPLPMVGDLDDTLFTLERAIEILDRLTADPVAELDRQQFLSDMYQLEFLLTDELGLILTDLLPALRAVRSDPSAARTRDWKKSIKKLLGRSRRKT